MVVAFRWLLNKRDITAVVAPEDGKEVSLETISLRLAQLVGKNAKRFASTQKEVQADRKHLEELEERDKELDEQNKVYEDQIASGLQEKEELASKKGSLEAQLANQLAVNRELEVRLAGLRKLEEEAGKNEPEPSVGTEPGKDAEPKPADRKEPEPAPTEPIEPEPAQDDNTAEPDWLKSMHDIIDGKYDNHHLFPTFRLRGRPS